MSAPERAPSPADQLDRSCPPAVHALLDCLAAAGVGAYPVGGCVRDSLMGRVPHDWDIAVTCPPEQTVALCAAAGWQTVPTGLEHGTVTVLVPDGAGDPAARLVIECTTCRTEIGYSDGRHPDRVAFSERIQDDLSRRDFTVNAMAAERDPAGHFHIIDLFGGQADLRAGVIRCVGDPERRLREDALRVLRGVRFSVKLGFRPEPATRAALHLCAPGLARVSGERVREELRGILLSPDPDGGVRMLYELSLTPHILPHPAPVALSLASCGGFAGILCGSCPEDPDFLFASRLAALLWGLDQPSLEADLARLRLSNAISDRVRARLTLATWRPEPAMPLPEAARRLRARLGSEALPALELRRVYASATSPADASLLSSLDELARAVALSASLRDPVLPSDLALSGRDLIALGVPPGRAVGRALSRLLDAVLRDPSLNTRDALSRLVVEGDALEDALGENS